MLERLTGLALGADDLRLMVSGCLADNAAPADGRQWPGGWRPSRSAPSASPTCARSKGQPVVVAADYGPWHVDYSAHASGFPRVVRVRRARRGAPIDITARIEQLEVNTAIDPRAFDVEIPSDAEPMTLDELRSVAPLARPKAVPVPYADVRSISLPPSRRSISTCGSSARGPTGITICARSFSRWRCSTT